MFFLRNGDFDIEIKCTSCKAIVKIDTKGGDKDERVYRNEPVRV